MGILDRIRKENDIKNIAPDEYGPLAEEIRAFLIEKVSATGGHLASNLGAVELTMALHLALDLPRDRIVWDVGHQSYTHKILTGRKDGFDSLRQMGGLSGFPKRQESRCDSFDTGHSSTSISAALGMVRARDLRGGDQTVVAVIGDGAMTGGLAYEGLNNASRLESNLIIVLNDNEMSISANVGGLPKYLSEMRTSSGYMELRDRIHDSLSGAMPRLTRGISRAKQSIKSLVVPGMFFEEMGITYLGPVDGHDVAAVADALRDAKRVKKAVLVHVLTKKGIGYGPAERDPARFHGTPPFDIRTGAAKQASTKQSWTGVFSQAMLDLAAGMPDLVAITAAMEDGVGLRAFHERFPDRFFDVGIAEQHAVTFAAGLAAGGLRPVVAVYSTFLQRAYDQIASDVCLQGLPVVFAIDRAGIVGADGETHQGILDLSYLCSIPGMTVMAPKNKWELGDMLRYAVSLGRPVAIRYPRGQACDDMEACRAPIRYGKAEMVEEACGAMDRGGLDAPFAPCGPSAGDTESAVACGGSRIPVLLLAVGSMVAVANEVRARLLPRGIDCAVANARFARPVDEGLLLDARDRYALLVTMEENVARGGFGEHVAAFCAARGIRLPFLPIAIPDIFVPQGSPARLMEKTGIDAGTVADKILQAVGRTHGA